MSGEDVQGQERHDTSPQPTIVDLLSLEEPAGALVNWILRRREARLPDIAAFLGQDEPSAQAFLAPLIEQGFVQVRTHGDDRSFVVRLAATPTRAPRKAIRDVLYDL